MRPSHLRQRPPLTTLPVVHTEGILRGRAWRSSGDHPGTTRHTSGRTTRLSVTQRSHARDHGQADRAALFDGPIQRAETERS